MSDLTLDHIHATDGITIPNFFNGRILSAEDLRLLLDGDRSHRRLLGRAVGHGVADGLRVTRSSATTVTVGAGVAVNGHGETVHLPGDIELELGGSSTSTPVSAGVFLDCDPTASGTTAAEQAYVLTIRPDSTVAGSAPADVAASGASCGPGFVREGVRFRRVAFDPVALWQTYGPELDLPTSTQRRNALAHLFLGSWAWRFFNGHPFDRTPMLDAAANEVGIDLCEVPLATFALAGGGIRDLDLWGVRRRLHGSDATALEHLAADVRRANGEAALHQFQGQLEEVVAGPGTVLARDRFVALPAAGVLPRSVLGNASSAAAFGAQTQVPFFMSLPHEALDVEISADRVEEILRRGTEMPAILPTAGFGVPIHVALVGSGLEAERYAIFFAAAHPAVDLVRIDELIERLDDLETRIDIDPETGPAVAVLYKPPKKAGATTGGVWSQWFLGPNPELAVGEAGLLRFEVLTSDAGEYQLDVSVGAPHHIRTGVLNARLVGVEGEPIPDPHVESLNAGKVTVLVQVTASKRPFLFGRGGARADGGFGAGGSFTRGEAKDVLAEVPVTLAVSSTADPSVEDSASVIVAVTT